MHAIKPHTVLLAVFLLIGAPFALPVHAAEEEAIQVPASATAIWQAIDQRTATLEQLIQAGTLDEVHHHAFAIRDLSTALSAHSAALSSAQRQQLDTNVKFIAVLAQRLDASGDSKDRAGAEANLIKLKSVLKSMRALYPTLGAK